MTLFEQRRRNEGESTQKASSRRKDTFQRLAMGQVEKRADGDVYDSDYSKGRAMPTTGVEHLTQRIRDVSLVNAQKQKAGDKGGSTGDDSSISGVDKGKILENYSNSYEHRLEEQHASKKEIAHMKWILDKKIETGKWEYLEGKDHKYLTDWIKGDYKEFKKEG